MNSAPVCSPNILDSDDGDVSGKLSCDNSDIVEDPVPDENDVVNGCASVNGDCEKLSDSDSDDGCDGLADGSTVHRLVVDCQENGSMALDVSRRGLQSFCHKLSKLSHLQVI